MSTAVEKRTFDLGGDFVVAALGQALLAHYQDLNRMLVPQTMQRLIDFACVDRHEPF
jgi:hypothetical protein